MVTVAEALTSVPVKLLVQTLRVVAAVNINVRRGYGV